MRPEVIIKGYEDSASGSEDESVSKMTKPKVWSNGPTRSSYLIKPVERSFGKKSRNDTVDDSSSDDGNFNEESSLAHKHKKIKTSSSGKKTQKIVKNPDILDEYSFNTVFVVDYDMTLVDRNAQPFPSSKTFIRDLYNFNNGRSTLVLYSHATSGHVQRGLSTHFAQEAEMFTEIITDHTMSKNKPVTQVRRVLSNIADLSGPFIIIDDARFNLDEDQYDITIDVSRHFIRNKSTDLVIGIDYKTIWCLLNESIKNWLQTKNKKTKELRS